MVFKQNWSRTAYLSDKYNISEDEYEALWVSQGSVCAVCGQPETTRSKKGTLFSLAVDHDHETGRVRGLLCRRCNTVIGLFEEDADLFHKAVLYLNVNREKHDVC